jgi:hypothetical protein
LSYFSTTKYSPRAIYVRTRATAAASRASQSKSLSQGKIGYRGKTNNNKNDTVVLLPAAAEMKTILPQHRKTLPTAHDVYTDDAAAATAPANELLWAAVA